LFATVLDLCCLFLAEIPCSSNAGMKYHERLLEKLLMTFQTFDRLVLKEEQNCCQEDDFASRITLLTFALHRLKMITSRKSHVCFIRLKACFLFLTAMSHCLFQHWNSDFERPLGLMNSVQSSFANTGFEETVRIVH